MILAIDGYEANETVKVGIGRYAFELLIHFIALNRRSRMFETIRIYVPGSVSSHMPPASDGIEYRVVPVRKFWTFIGFPLRLFLDRPEADVVFSPTHYVPRYARMPRVMAIMDVSYLSYPQLFTAKDRYQLTSWTAYSVRHTAAIVTISAFSKHAIIDAYHVPEQMVTIAYPALTEDVTKRMPNTTKTAHHKPYILSVGTLQPRKNFARLIEAVSQLSDRDVTLKIVGKKGWLYEDILGTPKQFGIEHRIEFLDFVPDDALPALYEGAACFALPSLYEGFGLPVLEAMAHGTPVVISNTSSLPEIAGDAGIYVNPEDVGSIRDGLDRALKLTASERKALVSKGLVQVKKFSWDRAAESVMDTLTAVARKGAA